jgi:hypothetical protein
LTRTRPASRIARALAFFALAAVCAPLRAEILINPAGWRFPNIVTAEKEHIMVTDRTPVIPGKETINRAYRRIDGSHFMTYEIEGRVFGVEIDEDGKPPFEYSIMDTDGDGKFETMIRYSKDNKDRAYVPRWVIDYYFSLHPDVKPGPAGRATAPVMSPSNPPKAPAAAQTPPPRRLPPLPPPDRPNP